MKKSEAEELQAKLLAAGCQEVTIMTDRGGKTTGVRARNDGWQAIFNGKDVDCLIMSDQIFFALLPLEPKWEYKLERAWTSYNSHPQKSWLSIDGYFLEDGNPEFSLRCSTQSWSKRIDLRFKTLAETKDWVRAHRISKPLITLRSVLKTLSTRSNPRERSDLRAATHLRLPRETPVFRPAAPALSECVGLRCFRGANGTSDRQNRWSGDRRYRTSGEEMGVVRKWVPPPMGSGPVGAFCRVRLQMVEAAERDRLFKRLRRLRMAIPGMPIVSLLSKLLTIFSDGKAEVCPERDRLLKRLRRL